MTSKPAAGAARAPESASDAPAGATTRTPVLFIAGFGRSGSTILGQVLGAAPGVIHVGELNFIWEHNFRENRQCGCGQTFDLCPFWGEVIDRAFGGYDAIDAQQLAALASQGTRTRHAALMLSARGRERLAKRLQPYVGAMARLYDAIGTVAAADVIVDSSKLPQYGFLLGTSSDIDLRVVHLLRDPRATAYSWLRRSRTEGGTGRAYLPRIGTTESALTWDAWNVTTELMWRRADGRYLRMRYEDFTRSPRAAVDRVLAHAGVSDRHAPFVDEQTVALGVTHTVAGNPNRFEHGTVAIRSDDEWRTQISATQRRVVTALTFPVLLRYGYPLRTR